MTFGIEGRNPNCSNPDCKKALIPPLVKIDNKPYCLHCRQKMRKAKEIGVEVVN